MKLNWGSSILIAYLIFVSGLILLVIISSKEKFELVTENYYEKAVKFEQQIEATGNALNAKNGIAMKYLPERHSILVSNKDQESISCELTFYKPDKASQDYNIDFTIMPEEDKIIPLKIMSHGNWKIISTWNVKGKAFYKEEKLFVK